MTTLQDKLDAGQGAIAAQTDLLTRLNGGQLVDNTTTVDGSFKAIQCVGAVAFDTVVGNVTNLNGKTVTNATIEGVFTSVKLTSGTAILYKL